MGTHDTTNTIDNAPQTCFRCGVQFYGLHSCEHSIDFKLSPWPPAYSLDEQILAELRAIRALLEKKP